ncbi:MAG TPA: DMT family transporter [Marinagarivorans sp.]
MPRPDRDAVSYPRGMVALYSATVILSINGVLSKVIPLDAITTTFIRCVIAFFALCFMLRLQKSEKLFQLGHSRNYWQVIVIGFLMTIHWSSFFHAMQVSTVAIGILAHYSYPVLTVILEPILDKKRPQVADLMAGFIVLIGVAVMVPSWQLHSQALIGAAFGLLSACAWSTRNVLQRRWLARESGQSIMAYQLLVIVVLSSVFCDYSALFNVSYDTWLVILLLGVVSTAFGHTLFSIALRAISAKSVSLISCLQPPLAILLSGLILAEIPNLQTIIGGSIILCVALYEAVKMQGNR